MVEFKPISLSPSSSQTSQEETPAPAIPREARGPTNPRRAPISRCIHGVPLSKPCEKCKAEVDVHVAADRRS